MAEKNESCVKVERSTSPMPIVGDQTHLEQESGHSGAERPKRFSEYPGQEVTKENLRVYVNATLKRGGALDHVILYGPPGLGKTTLAHIVANELSVPIFSTSGPSIDRPGDLAGLLAGLEENAILFIDEIHRLSVHVEEVLYSAMEDFSIDIIVGQGAGARSVSMPIKPFTLVGATTKLSLLSRPFLNRFGIQEKLDYYDIESLAAILLKSSEKSAIGLGIEGARELAARSRGTPRIALRLLRRVWDFAQVEGRGGIDTGIIDFALERIDIDKGGLDRLDRQILKTIRDKYNCGPVGIDTLAISIGEDKSTIEDVHEPFLIYSGFLVKGPRGRSLTSKGSEHIA